MSWEDQILLGLKQTREQTVRDVAKDIELYIGTSNPLCKGVVRRILLLEKTDERSDD